MQTFGKLLLITLIPMLLNACASSAPYVADMPQQGWQQYRGLGVKVWLPSSFHGGEPHEMLNKLYLFMEKNKELSQRYGADVKQLEAMSDKIHFYAVVADDELKNGDGTTMMVMRMDAPRKVDMKMLLNAMSDTQASMNDMDIKAKKVIQLPNYEAGFIKGSGVNNLPMIMEMYLIQKGGAIWIVFYVTEENHYSKYKPIFHQSIVTLQIEL